MVQARVAGRAAVDVPEELPDVAVRAAIAEEGVVVQDDGLPANADGHLLGDQLESAHIALAESLYVVVAQDEVLAAGEGAEDVVPKAGVAVCKVPEVEDDAVLRYGFLPATDELGIHLLRVSERAVAVADDALVAEVGVGGEKHLVRFEFVDLFGHVLNRFLQISPLNLWPANLCKPCKDLLLSEVFLYDIFC